MVLRRQLNSTLAGLWSPEDLPGVRLARCAYNIDIVCINQNDPVE